MPDNEKRFGLRIEIPSLSRKVEIVATFIERGGDVGEDAKEGGNHRLDWHTPRPCGVLDIKHETSFGVGRRRKYHNTDSSPTTTLQF